MLSDKRKMIGLLRLEIETMRRLGSGTFFRDALLCLNAGRNVPSEACSQCELLDLVPLEFRHQPLPCLHIPLDAAGHTAASLASQGRRRDCEQVILAWMERTLERLERELAAERARPKPH